MPNIDRKRRRAFEVYIDKGIPGSAPIVERVIVEPGEDADDLCGSVLETMISNEIDSGWNEIENE